MTAKPACRVWLTPKTPYRTIVSCDCGWQKMVFHRNALARRSVANGVANAHMKQQKELS